MNKLKQIVPAVPGTTVIWYNHCHDITIAEPVLFWGVKNEDEGENRCSFVVPLVLNELGGFLTTLEMPERQFPEGDKRHKCESFIVAYEIPGWGRIQLASDSGIKYKPAASGFVEDFGLCGGQAT